ncbi:MAG: CpsD/CapB family tyrosine-protein kinase [Planctomycetota bacterium]|nr:CpsD/CapB family tyrosine-protein kinase [Planctomycetota bacterium]
MANNSQSTLQPADPEEAKAVSVNREEIAVLLDPRGHIAEQFRGLRNSIHTLNPDGASHTLVVTSALPKEGKTVATVNLACALAELSGVEVLVVDADLHGPEVESYFSLPRRQGLTEVLSGRLDIDRAVRQTSVDGVSILGAGELPANPSELLASDRMRSLLNRLRQRFSYVILDTPQAMTVSDASLLGAMADGILLVVRMNSTPRNFVEQTHNTLEALGGNILGTCLTGAVEVDTSKA